MNEIYDIMDALKPLNPAQYPEVLLRRLVVLATAEYKMTLDRPRVFTTHTLRGETERFHDLMTWANNMLGFVDTLQLQRGSTVKCAG